MFKRTVCALLVLSAPALGTYSIDLVAPDGGSTITLQAPPTTEQVFDIGVYLNCDGPGEAYLGAEMTFVASSPAISLQGTIGSTGLSGQGTRYNDALFKLRPFDPDDTAAVPAYPGPSGVYGASAPDRELTPLTGRNLLGIVSVRILPSITPGAHFIRTGSVTPVWSGPDLVAFNFDSVVVAVSSVSFEILPEPAAGLLLMASLPLLRRRSLGPRLTSPSRAVVRL